MSIDILMSRDDNDIQISSIGIDTIGYIISLFENESIGYIKLLLSSHEWQVQFFGIIID